MKTELQFLEYMEKQIISAGEKIYTAWLKQEISFRKSELDSPQSTGDDTSMLSKASIRQPCNMINSSSREVICKPETLGDTIQSKHKAEIDKDYENNKTN
jgi:hypothetical protein